MADMEKLMAKLDDGTHHAVLVAKGSIARNAGEENGMKKQTKMQRLNAAVAKSAKAKKAAVVDSATKALLERAKGGKAPKVTMTKPEAVNAAMQAVQATKAKAPKAEKPKRTSGLDAAAQVLAQAKKPLSAKAMVETMLAKGLWKTGGKTPEATIYAAIIREIAAKKEASRFVKTGRGEFALAQGK